MYLPIYIIWYTIQYFKMFQDEERKIVRYYDVQGKATSKNELVL